MTIAVSLELSLILQYLIGSLAVNNNGFNECDAQILPFRTSINYSRLRRENMSPAVPVLCSVGMLSDETWPHAGVLSRPRVPRRNVSPRR